MIKTQEEEKRRGELQLEGGITVGRRNKGCETYGKEDEIGEIRAGGQRNRKNKEKERKSKHTKARKMDGKRK